MESYYEGRESTKYESIYQQKLKSMADQNEKLKKQHESAKAMLVNHIMHIQKNADMQRKHSGGKLHVRS